MIKFGFFDAVMTNGSYDRTYNADSFNDYLSQILSNGVLMARDSGALQVVANNGMNINIKAGEGRFDNHFFISDTVETLTVDTSDVTLPRIDRVVVRVDYTNREIVFAVLKGSPNSRPVPPTLTRTTETFEYSLAQVYVAATTSAITQANITDERLNGDVCGVVSGLVDQVDVTELWTQYQNAMEIMLENSQNDFDDWFNEVKDTLTATSLFREYKYVYTTTAGQTVVPIPVIDLHYNGLLDILHVYVNGFRLVENIDYTKVDDTIVFTEAFEFPTQIELANWKSVDGTGADSLVSIVEDMQVQVDNIVKYEYVTTGTNDNVNLNNLVSSFFNETGAFAGISHNASAEINVKGEFNITDSTTVATATVEGTAHNSYLSFVPTNNSYDKKLTINFANAIVNVDLTTNADIETVVYVKANNKIKVDNLRMNIITGTGVSGMTFKAMDTDGETRDIVITATLSGSGTFDGINGTKILNSNVLMSAATGSNWTGTMMKGTLVDSCKINATSSNTETAINGIVGADAIIDKCEVILNAALNGNAYSVTNCKVTNSSATVTAKEYSFGYAGTGEFVNCTANSTSTTSGNANGFYISGSATNCDAVAKHNTADAYGFRIYNNTGVLSLNGCVGRGYITAISRIGAGFYAQGTASTILCTNCVVPRETIENYGQTYSIYLAGSTTGAKYCLMGNVLFQAVAKHSQSGNFEYGTMIR